MATAYKTKTPGVYIDEIAKFPPSVAPVETAIPAFIGYTEKAVDTVPDDLILKAKRILSMLEYEKYFGLAQQEEKIEVTIATDGGIPKSVTVKLDEAKRSKYLMYYSLQMYFANGGGPCFIVSVDKYADLGTAPDSVKLKEGLTKIEVEDEPTLIVFPDSQNLAKIGDFGLLQDLALQQCEALKDRFVIMDVHGGDVDGAGSLDLNEAKTDLVAAVKNFRSSGVPSTNLKYGAAYAPNLETVLDFRVDEEKTVVKLDGVDKTLKALNTPPVPNTPAAGSFNTQAYNLAKTAIAGLPCKLPPSAAVAGIYAAVDRTRGVWKAPANLSVTAVIQPTIQFSNTTQDDLNVDPTAGKSVNAIRPFIGQGTLVWGARTLAGNDNEWRYINVRRLFIFIEESVKKATMQFVFESNDANTWVKVQGMIENFLTTLWRQGALQGVKPEHAFYVSVGLGKTMTALDILEGRMIVEIGLAAVRPAEFIILQFSHKLAVS